VPWEHLVLGHQYQGCPEPREPVGGLRESFVRLLPLLLLALLLLLRCGVWGRVRGRGSWSLRIGRPSGGNQSTGTCRQNAG